MLSTESLSSILDTHQKPSKITSVGDDMKSQDPTRTLARVSNGGHFGKQMQGYLKIQNTTFKQIKTTQWT